MTYPTIGPLGTNRDRATTCDYPRNPLMRSQLCVRPLGHTGRHRWTMDRWGSRIEDTGRYVPDKAAPR